MPTIPRVSVRFPGPQGPAGTSGGPSGPGGNITASQITDSTAAGRNMLTASNVTAQQALLNLPTLLAAKSDTGHTHTASQISDLMAFLSGKIIAGANVTVTYNSGAGTLTISSTGGGGGGGGGDALVANPLSQFAATTSAQLAGVMTDETGAAGGGVLVFNNNPVFTGTPTAPTATQGTNTTQLATCAFVNAAVAAVGSGGSGAYSIAYAAAITPALASGSVANVGTLTGNMLVNAPTGTPTDGQRITFRLNQNAAGGWTVSWDAAYRFGLDLIATDLATSPNAENRITFQYNSTAAKWEAVGLVRF